MFEKVTKVCKNCSCEFEGLNLPRWTLCGSCVAEDKAREAEAWKARTRPRIPFLVDQRLSALGLSTAERAADPARIPPAIADTIPEEVVGDLVSGRAPRRGFGLSGSMGAGKTMALAAILKVSVRKRMEVTMEAMTDAPDWAAEERWQAAGAFRWVSWPQTAAAMKGAFKGRHGNAEVEDLVERLCGTQLLILDDLGRERMRGAYTEDFAIGQLDRIIDARSRESRPILWTTNQDRTELEDLYGAAMVDRLLGLAPLLTLPALRSLRGSNFL